MRFTLPRIATAAALLFALVACGGSGSTEPEEDLGPGSLTIALGNQGRISVAVGGTATVPVNVSRRGSFTGPITIQVSNLPTGVTASALSIPSGQLSGNLTLTAAANAPKTTIGTASVAAVGAGVSTVTAFLNVSVI